jgi:hypothetical protein
MKTRRLILFALIITAAFFVIELLVYDKKNLNPLFVIFLLQPLVSFTLLFFLFGMQIDFGKIFIMTFFTLLFSYAFLQLGSFILMISALSAAGAPDASALAIGVNVLSSALIGIIVILAIAPVVLSGLFYGIFKLIALVK